MPKTKVVSTKDTMPPIVVQGMIDDLKSYFKAMSNGRWKLIECNAQFVKADVDKPITTDAIVFTVKLKPLEKISGLADIT